MSSNLVPQQTLSMTSNSWRCQKRQIRVFANGLGDLGSIPGQVITNTQKMVLDASLHYKVWIKGKVSKSWKGVTPSLTPWCSSYRKGSLQVTLDYSHQLYLVWPQRGSQFENSLRFVQNWSPKTIQELAYRMQSIKGPLDKTKRTRFISSVDNGDTHHVTIIVICNNYLGSHSTNTLGKAKNPNILPPTMSTVDWAF